MTATSTGQLGDAFFARIVLNRIVFHFFFPLTELRAGASLSRMMTLKIRKFAEIYGHMFDVAALRAGGRKAVGQLRDEVENHFLEEKAAK